MGKKKKTYGVYGMVEYSMVIGSSGSNIRVDFKHGSMTVRGIEPCTFTTDNEAVQKLIENTEKFKKGHIKIVRSESVASDKQPEQAPSSTESNPNVYPSVKNSQQARDVLIGEPYLVPLSELGNKEAILGVASSVGVSFPNWKQS